MSVELEIYLFSIHTAYLVAWYLRRRQFEQEKKYKTQIEQERLEMLKEVHRVEGKMVTKGASYAVNLSTFFTDTVLFVLKLQYRNTTICIYMLILYFYYAGNVGIVCFFECGQRPHMLCTA